MNDPQEVTERHPAMNPEKLQALARLLDYDPMDVHRVTIEWGRVEVTTYDPATSTLTTHVHTDMAEDQQEPQPRPLIEKGRVERIQLDPRGMGYIRVADEQEPPC